MRKYFGVIAALLLSVAPAFAQVAVERIPLAIAYDMDGEAADDDQIVLGPDDLTDSTSYTVDAQPDTCRIVNITVTDADSSISAGVLTVTGTDCYGDAQTCTFTFAGGGSGVKALTYGTGNGQTCAFASVTTVATGVLTGEGGAADEFEAGYTANSAYTYPIFGIRKTVNGRRYVDPFASEPGKGTITINGTAVASYATADGGAFQNLAAGDLIYITVNGVEYERILSAVASDDAATLGEALPTSIAPATTAEVRFRYKKFFKLVESTDAWIPVRGAEAFFDVVEIDGCSATGGCTTSVECTTQYHATSTIGSNVQVDTDNVADAATGEPTTSVDLRLAPYGFCRVGVKFGTGDTSGTENIDIFAYITKRQ